METHLYAEIYLPEAADYADLTGIKNDLEQAKVFAHELIAIKNKLLVSSPYPVEDAFGIASLVKYSRCFATGKRKELGTICPNIINDLPEAYQEWHKKFCFAAIKILLTL